MKTKAFIVVFFLIFSIDLIAQSELDALTFTQFLPSGSARYTAMGGAFGALGADMATMATNPAGTGLYRKSEIGISTAWTQHNTFSEFNNSERSANQMSFQLANMGFVVVNPISSNSGWKSVNVGFVYNHLNDFNNSYYIEGNNYESSLLDLHANMLNNNSIDSLYNPFFKADVVFHNSDDDSFYNDFNYGGSYYGATQTHRVETSGYAGEYDLNFSTNYNDIIYLGATFGFQQLRYSRYTNHKETAFSNEIALKDFESIDNLEAKGSGFNLKLGMIFKISHMVRIGASFHTPTMFNIRYDYWNDVYAKLDFGSGNINNVGRSPLSNYNWEFVSPAKYMLSGAVVLSRMAIISGEVEYLNYSKMNISSSDYYFEEENNNINSIYKESFNAKLGVELRLWMLSLRAGAGYMDSPYKSSEPNTDAYHMIFSGGIGVNMGMVYFDVAYQYITSNSYYYMYGYESSKVSLTNNSNKFMATLGFRF